MASVVVASMLVVVPASSAATVFTEGFETGNLSAWSGSKSFSVQQSTVRTGAWAGRASSTGAASHAWRTIPPATEVRADLWFRVESRSTAVWLTALRRSTGTPILLVGLDKQGKIIAKNVVANSMHRSSTVVGSGAWHRLEVHAETGGGGGFDVSLDGAPVITQIANLGSNPVGRFAIGDPNKRRTYRVAFDDVEVDDEAAPPGDPRAVIGEWSDPVDLGVVGVHAILLHTGKVLLYYQTLTGADSAVLFDPATGAVSDAGPPLDLEYDLFCSAHVVRRDGEVFVVGGTEWNDPTRRKGTTQTAYFDPGTETWRAGPEMGEDRWYPSVASLEDGDTLVVAGERDKGDRVWSLERFVGSTGSFTTLPATADLDMHTYPRIFFLPDGDVVRVGTESETMFFDPSTATWTPGPDMSTGRVRGSAVLLPGLDRLLAIGGADRARMPTTASTEILDLGAAKPSWKPMSPMHEPRRNFNAILLPDGTVFVVGGNRGTDDYSDPVMSSEIYDPQADRWTVAASQQAPRAYHSTAVLLPDGRVLSAGQDDGTMQTTAEIYSPPYLFDGPRPTIAGAPTDLSYAGSFQVDTPQADTVDSVVLIRPGTITHGVQFDQRWVELDFTRGASTLTVDAPASGFEAPPGMYMLFLVRDGVPSVAAWVGVG